MRWTDIEDIAEALEEAHPEVDVMHARFPALQAWVLALQDFQDTKDRCNERILEAIQGEWLALRNEK